MTVIATLTASLYTPDGLLPVEVRGIGASKTEARLRADASLRERLDMERAQRQFGTVTIHAVHSIVYE